MKPIVYFKTLAVGRLLMVTLFGVSMFWSVGFAQVPMDVAQSPMVQDTFPTKKGQEKATPAKRADEKPANAEATQDIELERLAASDLYVVTVDDHLHLKPDGNSPVVFVLKEGDQVMTTGRAIGYWREVAFLEQRGWVKSILIVPLTNYEEAFPEYSFVKPSPADRQPTLEKQTLIIQQETSLRAGPSSDFAVLTRLTPNEKVELLEKTNSLWWKVKYGTQTGYVKAFLLKDKRVKVTPPASNDPAFLQEEAKSVEPELEPEEVAPTDITPRFSAFYLTQETSLRTQPNSQSSVLLRFAPNDKVEVLEETNRFWWKVQIGGEVGFVKAHLLSPQEVD
jgi:SH3-like domain-containing protein